MKCESGEKIYHEPMLTSCVSVIVPAYNAAKFIDDALLSVREQTFQDYEVIVVDDCSTDNTAELAEVYAVDARFLVVKRSSNGGVSAALNTGIKHARGEWLAFLGSDDIWLPNKLDEQLSLLKDYPDSSLLFTNGIEFNERGDLGPFYRKKSKFPTGRVLARLLKNNCFWASSVMVKRQDMMDVGMFDETISIGEDYLAWMKILAKGGSAAGVWDPQVRYRKREDSLSSDYMKSLCDAELIYNRIAAVVDPLCRRRLRSSMTRVSADRLVWQAYSLLPLRRWEALKKVIQAFLQRPGKLCYLGWMSMLMVPSGAKVVKRKISDRL